MGYHLREIEKGVLGDSSKIKEELFELLDAEDQQDPVMILIELCDIVGACRGYLERKFPGQNWEAVVRHANRHYEECKREERP